MNAFIRKIGLLTAIVALSTSVQATHNRAGQIIYKHVSGQTYEFTVTTFTYSLSQADRPELDISWGDNTYSTMRRSSKISLPDNYNKNTYIIRHTFPGAGVYTIVVEDPNRNLGVENIPNSVSVVFSVKTIFRIDPNFGINNAPDLLTYPVDKAAKGRIFIHNPSAFDIDGDSLSYELTPCTRDRGVDIETYTLPEYSDSLTVNPITGDLVWSCPVKVGIYNVAMKINEWRKGVKIGSISRDMQIEVVDSKNLPPQVGPFPPVCVIAGDSVSFDIHATDPDGDSISLTATGGPLNLPSNPAMFRVVGSRHGFTDAIFRWTTDLSHVRKQPYTVALKAEDQNTEVKLVAFANLNITVTAPPVEIMSAEAERKSISIGWHSTACTHASGYEIYRSIGENDVPLDTCAGGIPAGSGYQLIATLDNINDTTYVDTNNGRGLSPGIRYCYRIVTWFADGARSLPSDEACAVLLSGTPPLILASVKTVAASGTIEAAWLRTPLDSLIANRPGPFEYRLYYTDDTAHWSATPLYTTADMNDTLYLHSADTKNKHSHFYRVELWDTGKNELVKDDYETASTLYPALQPSDRAVTIAFERYTPWINTEYTIFRCTPDGENLDSIGVTDRETFTDTGLENGHEYCYRVRSRGYRLLDTTNYENENWSHIACAVPVDNVPPCAPEIEGRSDCVNSQNILTWTKKPDCMVDVAKYHIYYSPNTAQPYELVDSIISPDQTTYIHKAVAVGCYYVTAIDSNNNASAVSNTVCMDECGTYDLPNVFTPNGDNVNDIYKSFNPAGIKQVDMKIYDRWGKLVFKTTDPAINWDGRDIDSKNFVATGVYYYFCDVYEERITGLQIKTMTGFIHLYAGKDAKPFVQ